MRRVLLIALALAGLLLLVWMARELASERDPPAEDARPPGPAQDRAAREPAELEEPLELPPEPTDEEATGRSPSESPAPLPDRAELLQRVEAREFDGIVLDEAGQPAAAHIDVVGTEGGSVVSTDTEPEGEYKGCFGFEPDRERTLPERYLVKATTQDGLCALSEERSRDAVEEPGALVLELEPGGRLELTLEGERDNLRCAIFQDDQRHSDFRLSLGKPHGEVVPAGMNMVLVYDGLGEDLVPYTKRAVLVDPGSYQELSLAVP